MSEKSQRYSPKLTKQLLADRTTGFQTYIPQLIAQLAACETERQRLVTDGEAAFDVQKKANRLLCLLCKETERERDQIKAENENNKKIIDILHHTCAYYEARIKRFQTWTRKRQQQKKGKI